MDVVQKQRYPKRQIILIQIRLQKSRTDVFCNVTQTNKLSHPRKSLSLSSTAVRTSKLDLNSDYLKYIYIQQGLILRRFVLRRVTFTNLVESDRTLPTFSASLSQLKRPFSTQGVSSSFPMSMCFFLFECSSFKFIVIFPPNDVHQKDITEEKIKIVYLTFFLYVF